MTASRMTNSGFQWALSVSFTGAAPGATTDGDVGLALSGGVPSFFILLLTTAYNFTAAGGRPNPDHDTVAAILAAHPGCVVAPANYTGNAIARNRTRFTTTSDNTADSARIAFIPGQEPLLTLTANASNIGGWALCRDNNGTGPTPVLQIVGLNSPIATILANEQLRLTGAEGTIT